MRRGISNPRCGVREDDEGIEQGLLPSKGSFIAPLSVVPESRVLLFCLRLEVALHVRSPTLTDSIAWPLLEERRGVLLLMLVSRGSSLLAST